MPNMIHHYTGSFNSNDDAYSVCMFVATRDGEN